MAHKLFSSSDSEDPFDDDDDIFNNSAEIAKLDAALAKSKAEREAQFKAPPIPKGVLKKRENQQTRSTSDSRDPPAKKRKLIKSRPKPHPTCEEAHIPVKELACTKKKAEEIRSWLISASVVGIGSSTQKVLLVSGPNGCGKLTAIKSVCHEERVDIQGMAQTEFLKDKKA